MEPGVDDPEVLVEDHLQEVQSEAQIERFDQMMLVALVAFGFGWMCGRAFQWYAQRRDSAERSKP